MKIQQEENVKVQWHQKVGLFDSGAAKFPLKYFTVVLRGILY